MRIHTMAVAILAASFPLTHVSAQEDALQHSCAKYLSQGSVSSHSPDDLLRSIQADPSTHEYGRSLAGEDGFYQDYAAALRTHNDQTAPIAVRIRPDLTATFNHVADFLDGLLGGVMHYRSRIPAYVEWHIWNVSHPPSPGFQRRYTRNDIRSVGLVLVRAHWAERSTELVEGPQSPASASRFFMPPLDQGLSSLSSAERHVPRLSRYYLRRVFLLELAHFL
jgi:hypothetical protein